MRDFHFEASKSEAVCDSGCLSWKTAGDGFSTGVF